MTGATADFAIVVPNHKIKENIEQYVKDNDIDMDMNKIN